MDQELAELEAEVALEELSLDSAKKLKAEDESNGLFLAPAHSEGFPSISIGPISQLKEWQASLPGGTDRSETLPGVTQAKPSKGEEVRSTAS